MFTLLLGHLTGDYLLQNSWMALNKTKNTFNGWMAALVHCLIYTAAVCLFMWNFDMIWIGVVFLSHFPIDKFGLGDKYMHYLKGGGLKDYVYENDNPVTRLTTLEGGFKAFVYAMTDNTMHLILMWGAYQLIY